jgi:3-phosphoshikimate 1-carboxyvinyltransferase
VQGPIKAGKVITDGRLSQYISGLMMASTLIDGKLEIELTDPKEVPYLDMTKYWLESLGVQVEMSSDYKKISVTGPYQLKAFDKAIPSDWEAVAFPLIAALISDSKIVIDNVDGSGTQGDDAIVSVLQSVGADIQWNKETSQLFVTGGNRLSTENLTDKTLRVNLAGFPDAICALAVIACFIEGKTVLEDIGVCRRKETDRIVVMKSELEKLGAKVEEGEDYLAIYGNSPLLANGEKNPNFKLHGGTVESFDDHRVAMSLACLGLGLPEGQEVIVNDAECCSVSFPGFFEVMNKIKANFKEI